MTQPEIEAFLTKIIPQFQKKYACYGADYEDMLQKVCMVFARRAQTEVFENHAHALFYFKAIHYRVYRNVRSNAARAKGKLQYTESYEPLATGSSNYYGLEYPYTRQSVTDQEKIQHKAHELLDEIQNPTAAQVCKLHYVDGYTINEVAEQTGHNPRLVRYYVGVGLQQIRSALKAQGELQASGQ